MNAKDEHAVQRRLSAAEQWKQRDVPLSAVKIDQKEPRHRAFADPKPEWWPEWLFGRWV
jgi:hypothetical protein